MPIIWKCKYYNACGSIDNCAACRGKEEMIKKDLDKFCKKYKETKK